jgi:cytochrome c oxidase assembly protein subunit 11
VGGGGFCGDDAEVRKGVVMRGSPQLPSDDDQEEVNSLEEVKENNSETLKRLLLIIPLMLIFCASLVPLYRQICEVLGITATRSIVQNTVVDPSRWVKIDFDASLNKSFAWKFEPVQKHVEVHPGAVMTVNYRVTNTLPYATTGRAVPSFGPIEGGLYFNKIECFCFSNQTLQAGETRDMPVTFFIDPKVPSTLASIALSYTFFDVTAEQKRASRPHGAS